MLLRNRGVQGLRWMLIGVVALVGTATLLGSLDRFYWPFVFVGVFRLQYIVLLGGAAVLSIALRRLHLAGLATAFALINVITVGIPFATPAIADPSGPSKGSLRLVIANVENGEPRLDALENLIERENPDVVGIVELTPALSARLRRAFPEYDMHRVAAREGAYGIGVFSRLPIVSARVERFPDSGPPSVVARVRAAGEEVTIVVTHIRTPFAGSIHVRQLNALANARPRLGRRLAICGDFNAPPWSGPFRRLAEDGQLTDLYGDDAWSGYSWPTWNPLLRIPLDNCLVSEGLAVADHRKGADIGSDHFPLVVDVNVLAG